MAFRFDKLTLKAQEAVARAQELAADRGHAQIDPLHLLAALLGGKRRHRRADPGTDRRQSRAARQDRPGRTGPFRPRLRRGAAAGQPGTEPRARSRPARSRRDERRVRLDRAPAAGPDQGRLEGQKRPEAQRRHRQGPVEGVAGRPRQHPRDRPDAGRQVPGACSATASTWSSAPGRESSIR